MELTLKTERGIGKLRGISRNLSEDYFYILHSDHWLGKDPKGESKPGWEIVRMGREVYFSKEDKLVAQKMAERVNPWQNECIFITEEMIDEVRLQVQKQTNKSETWVEGLAGFFLFLWLFFSIPIGLTAAFIVPYGSPDWPHTFYLKPLVPVLYVVSLVYTVRFFSGGSKNVEVGKARND